MNINAWEALLPTFFCCSGDHMFELQDSLKFVSIDQTYLKHLYDVCSEVFYKPNAYDTKPYIGILLQTNGVQYVIPLTSAKPKHRLMKDIDQDRFLIYEYTNPAALSSGDIWTVTKQADLVKHILAAIDVKKMIPIKQGVYHITNLNKCPEDSPEQKKYKDLLNKEYSFCLKILPELLIRAGKLYDKQMQTGRVAKFCCDFKALEAVCAAYPII